MRCSVSGASVSASGSASSMRMRAMFSPGMRRSRPAGPSSVRTISASAVASQSNSGRPDRFLKPRTATARRTATAGSPGGWTGGAGASPPLRHKMMPAIARASAGTATTSQRRTGRRGARRMVRESPPSGSPHKAAATDRASGKRASGWRCRHRRIAPSHFGSRPGRWADGGTGASRNRLSAVASGVSATKGQVPVTAR